MPPLAFVITRNPSFRTGLAIVVMVSLLAAFHVTLRGAGDRICRKGAAFSAWDCGEACLLSVPSGVKPLLKDLPLSTQALAGLDPALSPVRAWRNPGVLVLIARAGGVPPPALVGTVELRI